MKYDQIIQDQKEKGIVEVVDQEPTGRAFSLPHKPVIREIPRSMTPAKESVKGIDLHAFGDASGNGVSAAVYAVAEQDSGINQGLGQGNYKQFVHNRVKQIQLKDYMSWRHVPTNDNPADIGSRGCLASRIDPKWFQGPSWLATKQD
eukprot:gene4174-20361_t